MRRWIWRAVLVLGVLAGIVLIRFTVLRKDPVPVTVFVVSRGQVEQTVTNSKAGSVMTRHRASLSPETGGRVAEVRVRKGDPVKAGMVLVRLDDAQHRAQAALAQRALEAGKQQELETCLMLEMAQKDLARTEGLARENIISAEMLDQARNRVQVSGAACEAGRARTRQAASQLEVVRAELAKTIVRAPFDGVVAEMRVERGEWVTPSPPGLPMPAVLDLLDPSSIYVSAPLDEVDRDKVRPGQRLRITMDAFPGRSFPGHVVRVAPYILGVAEQSRTFEVEAGFDDAAFARTLPPGASADIEIILSGREGVLRVPTYAVVEGKRVLVLQSDCIQSGGLTGTLARVLTPAGECLASKDVVLGLKNWEFAEITQGLSPGDRVVVSLDRAEVKEGARANQVAVTEK